MARATARRERRRTAARRRIDVSGGQYPRLEPMASGEHPYLHPGGVPQEVPPSARPHVADAVVLVASGKGGVGKSTISLNLALALADKGGAVGLLDADVYGPDIPLMLGLTRTKELKRWPMWRNPRKRPVRLDPVELLGIKVMSVGFLIAEDQALSLPASSIHFVLSQLVQHVTWGELDYLVVDLPPGTADVQQRIVELLRPARAIIVVSPQDVAHLDAKKVLSMLQDAGVGVLGGVENMHDLVCPHCGGEVQLFPAVAEARSIWSAGVERLATLPFDPEPSEATEQGRPLFTSKPDSAQAERFRDLVESIVASVSDP